MSTHKPILSNELPLLFFFFFFFIDLKLKIIFLNFVANFFFFFFFFLPVDGNASLPTLAQEVVGPLEGSTHLDLS